MTQLEIRLAAPRDIETVVQILNEANDWIVERGAPPWSPRAFRTTDAEGRIDRRETYLALADGTAIGTMTVQPGDETVWPGRPADALYVHRLAAGRAAHGRNAGADLLDFAARLARDAGKRYLRLDCHCDNSRLREYYVRRGFAWLGDRTVGTPPRAYCASLLERPLAETR